MSQPNISSKSLFGSVTNFTTSLRGPVWNFSSSFTLIVCVSSLLLNGSTFLIFLRNRHLRIQPFSVYLMFLLVYNFLLAALQNPLGIIDSLYSSWWLGKGWCIVYRYSGSVITALGMYTHVLVTFSRLWAITYPISYRRVHSRSTAVLLCTCMCTYVHIVYLPEFVPKMPRINPSTLTNCRAQYNNSVPVQIIMYVGAILIIFLAYPFICYKRTQRKKERTHRVTAPAASSKKAVTNELSHGAGRSEQQISAVTPTTTHPQRLPTKDPGAYGFAVLTLLTSSAIVCWTPATVIFLVNAFTPFKNHLIFQTVLSIFSVQPVLDPILFAISLGDLRKGFRQVF